MKNHKRFQAIKTKRYMHHNARISILLARVTDDLLQMTAKDYKPTGTRSFWTAKPSIHSQLYRLNIPQQHQYRRGVSTLPTAASQRLM